MKKRALWLLLLSAFLLLLLSACGSREIKVLDYGGTGENRYLAQQDRPKNNDGITAAAPSDGTLFYITKQSYENTYPYHPTILASLDGETGKILTWQSLRNGLEGLAEAEDFQLDNISAVSVQSDGSAVLVMEAKRGEIEYEDLAALVEAAESGTDQEEIEWFCEVAALDAAHEVRWSYQLPNFFLWTDSGDPLRQQRLYLCDGWQQCEQL